MNEMVLSKVAIRAKYEGCGIVSICGSNDPEDFVGNPEKLFSGGICPACRHGIGERTEVPLTTSSQLPANSDGCFVRVRIAGPYVCFSINAFSAKFIEALSDRERKQFKWLPVTPGKKSKKTFYEPVSLPLAGGVLPLGLFDENKRLQPDGFHCQKCGRKQLAGIPQGGAGIFLFISETGLPETLPACFQIGQSSDLKFCMVKKY